jgi:RimJ/RimL family protein N-acetyltransferase
MQGILRGDRVRLTPVTSSDLATIAGWHLDDAFLRFYDAVPSAPKTEAQLTNWLAEFHQSQTAYLFGIRPLEEEALIGTVDLNGILWSQRVCTLSVAIGDPAQRGKGYGTEAMELVLRFAFHELNLHRVELTVFSYNTRAIAVYERLGFVYEGAHREFLERDGQRFDMLRYGLLRNEWETSRSANTSG